MAEIIEQWHAIFESKEDKKKKDPTKLHWAEKTVGGLGIAGGLGAGVIGKTAEKTAEEALDLREKALQNNLGDKNTIIGSLKRNAYEANAGDAKRKFDDETLQIEAGKKAGKLIGDVGLKGAAVIGGGLAAHKLYKNWKSKKK